MYTYIYLIHKYKKSRTYKKSLPNTYTHTFRSTFNDSKTKRFIKKSTTHLPQQRGYRTNHRVHIARRPLFIRCKNYSNSNYY